MKFFYTVALCKYSLRRICLFRPARRFGGFAIRRQEMSQPIRA